MDHNSLASRCEFIQRLVEQNLGRMVSSIVPLGRDSNNYVHLVSLETAFPSIVVRLSNPDAMLNNRVRVENEVAAITLMQHALSNFPLKIVPNVYDWHTAAEGQGWIVQEYMNGELLGGKFSELSNSQKEHLLNQVAQVFKMIQSYTPNVTGFGGLNFDDEGRVITGELTIWFGGPFVKYEDMYLHILRKQMEFSQKTPLINGWKESGLGERLGKLDKSGGFAKLLQSYSEFRPTLVHGDLGLENILFDPVTLQVTALLDYDFAHVASPADEFFYSFVDFHGIIPGPFESEEMEQLRMAQISGFKDPLRMSLTETGDVDWKTAKNWQVALEQSGAKSPADIENIGELAAIYWFLLDVCPPYFLLPRWLKRRTEEQQLAAKREIENNLDKYLKRWDY